MLNRIMDIHEAAHRNLFMLGRKTERLPYNWRKSSMMMNLNVLSNTQWLSPEEIEGIQIQKIKRLLFYAFTNVPYYKRIFGEVGFRPEDLRKLEDLQGLPILTKKDVQDNGPDLLSRTARASAYYKNSTGGSTGEPLTFYQSMNYRSWAQAAIAHSFTMCGYHLGERKAFLWGSDSDSMDHRGWKNRWLNDLLRKNLIWINTFELTENLLEKAARTLVRFRPRLLVAYVSSATLLAKFLKEHEIKGIRPAAIQTSAELLTKAQRSLLEEVFGCPVFDRYGCREVSIIAHECEAHEGLHLLADNNYTEFLANGKPASAGETGLITVTNLNNLAMPFIRYQPGDLGVPGSVERCACGRGLPRMEVVAGRSTEVIITPSGRLLHGEFFTHLFYNLTGIRQFQVIQKTKSNLQVLIVPSANFKKDETCKFLYNNIKLHGDNNFDINIKIVDSISPSPSGKFKFVFSEILG